MRRLSSRRCELTVIGGAAHGVKSVDPVLLLSVTGCPLVGKYGEDQVVEGDRVVCGHLEASTRVCGRGASVTVSP
jgi:hypothetical protein